MGIKILDLTGNKYSMGRQYGIEMQDEMRKSLFILEEFYIDRNGVSKKRLFDKAEQFFNKYPYSFQKFLQGVAKGANMNLEEVKVLNAMETLNSLLHEQEEISSCLFLGILGNESSTGYNIIGRNYDFPEPFNRLSEFLTVTVLHEPDTVVTAFVAMAGQVYCPTCINQKSLFLEMNNGMPSGGYEANHERESMLVNLLQVLQNSASFSQLEKQLSALNSDYSLSISFADKNKFESYEFSSYRGNKIFKPMPEKVYVTTNFFLNQTWTEAPEPTDDSTWNGVSRRNNILDIFGKGSLYTPKDVMQIMNLDLEEGGAKWDLTIYQMVFDTETQDLFLKRSNFDDDWHTVHLGEYFNDNKDNIAEDICPTS